MAASEWRAGLTGDEMSGHFLIVEAHFYEALADAQVEGAMRALDAAGATHERVSVPGALEIPAAIAFAAVPNTCWAVLACLSSALSGTAAQLGTANLVASTALAKFLYRELSSRSRSGGRH